MYAPKYRSWLSDHERLIERRSEEFCEELARMAEANREWVGERFPYPPADSCNGTMTYEQFAMFYPDHLQGLQQIWPGYSRSGYSSLYPWGNPVGGISWL